jgi:hypothetical protein
MQNRRVVTIAIINIFSIDSKQKFIYYCLETRCLNVTAHKGTNGSLRNPPYETLLTKHSLRNPPYNKGTTQGNILFASSHLP